MSTETNTYNVISAELNIVHGGKAHRDDFLCACLAAALNGSPIRRSDPAADELASRLVLVMDVGGKLAPEVNNYDHHQLGRETAPACALTMLIEALGLEGFDQPWVTGTALCDSKGPFAYAKALGIEPKTLLDAQSPIEAVLLDMFEECECLRPGDRLYEIMREIGSRILETARARAARQAHLDLAAEVDEIEEEIWMIRLNEADTSGLNEWREAACPEAAVSVTLDDRGTGYTLYRFADHPRIDFSRLEGQHDILFAHKGGFIAKTRTRVSEERLRELLIMAIK